MGFGLMGAGAAVSGLVEGYQKGKKFAQDEERFDMEKERFGLEKAAADRRRRLDEEQIRGAGLLNRKAEGELGDIEYNRSIEADERAIVDRYAPLLNGASQAPAAPPSAASVPGAIPDPAAGSSAPEAVATPGGIPVPGQQPAQPPKSRFDLMRDMNTEILNNRLRMRGVDRGAILRQAIESTKFFSDAKTKTTLGALNAFAAGVPQEEILSDLAAQGVQLQPGTSFAVVDTKDRAGLPIQDVELRLPGGRVISREALFEQALTSKEIFDVRTNIGNLMATVRHHAAVEQNQREAGARDERQHRERMAELAAARQQRLEEIRLRKGELDLLKAAKQHTNIENSVVRLVGYKPLSEADRARLEKLDIEEPIHLGADNKRKKDAKGLPVLSRVEAAEAREAERAHSVFTIMAIGSMNIDEKTGQISATPAELMAAYQVSDPKAVRKEDDGRSYVNVGGRKVYVPAPPSEESSAPPAPAPAPGRPGLSTAPPAPAASSAVRASGQVSDQQLREAFRKYGAIGWKEGLLGPRPGIRNQSGVSAWDREAEALSMRLNTIMAQPKSR